MSESNGGYAFPMPEACTDLGSNPAQYGMTLRDWFAGMALQGMLAWPGDNQIGSAIGNGTFDNVAGDAYSYADAMIAARNNQSESKP